ncbi:MAG: hypothetical protein AABZ74_15975 [Cyanobacteriota bacterium]
MNDKSFFLYVFIIASLIFSCVNPTSQNSRKNPEPPIKVADPKDIYRVPVLPLDATFDAVAYQIIRPELEKLTFNLEIVSDGILSRVIVNDGELLSTPAKVQIKGGKTKVELLDLVLNCRIAQYYVIDKDTTLDFTGPRGCREQEKK